MCGRVQHPEPIAAAAVFFLHSGVGGTLSSLHSCHLKRPHALHARARRTLDKTQPPKELQSFPSLRFYRRRWREGGREGGRDGRIGARKDPSICIAAPREIALLRFVVYFAMQTWRGRVSPADRRERDTT